MTRRSQLAAIGELGRLLPYSARVQDGFTGVGCLHRSADYWWWINEHSIKLLDRLGELPKLRARLKANPPDAYLVDYELRNALLPLERDISQHFQEAAANDALRFELLLRTRP